MSQKEMVAMLLAGGEGKRLGVLTRDLAKPAVHFGGKYRIIDFTLSNCANSGMDTVGVLTQYQPLVLNRYLGIGSPWGLDGRDGGMAVLPPYMKQKGGIWYKGTANAIYQNMSFIERYNPEYVLIISGDHIYKMDYDLMLQEHKRSGAEATIACIEVELHEAGRFGIMSTDNEGRIVDFEEKPKNPASNLASMGIYIFSWPLLQQYLVQDEADRTSSNDFGKDIIPAMLRDGIHLQAYRFAGYWKDVGTLQSLWEANMDLLADHSSLDLFDRSWRIYSVNPNLPGHYASPEAKIDNSLVTEGCVVKGRVQQSILSYGVQIDEDAVITQSVIMPHVRIGKGVRLHRAIVGEGAVIESGVAIGDPADLTGEVTVIGSEQYVIGSTTYTEVEQA